MAAAAAVALATVGTVGAHAGLETADPAPGSTIPEAPELVTADFTDRLDPALSSLTLAGPDGTILASGGVAPEDPEARQMALRPPALAEGVYTVGWTAVSDDDKDVETGSYTFTIAVPTPAPTATSQATASPVPTPDGSGASPTASPPPPATPTASPVPSAPSAPPSASPSPGGPGDGQGAEPIALAIVIALVAAVAAGAFLAYRRRARGTPA
jgi:hypothetical protein